MTSEEAAIARAAANQLAVATMVLLDRGAQVRERAIQQVAGPLAGWYGDASRMTRSVQDSLVWLQRQLSGQFAQHLASFLCPLRSAKQMQSIGFRMPKPHMPVEEASVWHLYAIEDNERAADMSKFAFTLLGQRVVRSAYWLHGWWPRSYLFLSHDVAQRGTEAQAFRRAVEAYEQAKHHFDEPGVQELYEHSQFRLPPVQQLVVGMKEGDWNISYRMHLHLEKRHHRLISLEPIENCFHRQKRMKSRDMYR